MIPLVMKMRSILRQRMAERRFPTQDQSRQALLFDGAHPALRVGVQMRRPRWQGHPLDAGLIDETLKRWAECIVSVMDEILPRREEAPLLHRHVTGDLHHPRCSGMRRHPRDMDLPAAQVDEE